MSRRTIQRLLHGDLEFVQLQPRTQGLVKHRFAILLPSILVIGAALVCLAATIDEAVHLHGDGIGLSRHYGIWSIFITSPVLVVITSWIICKWKQITDDLGQYTVGEKVPKPLQAAVRKHLDSLYLKRNTKYLLLLFVIIGWYCSLVNIKQTIYPLDSYANDVFDSYEHFWGFLSFKVYLTFLWSLVYPLVAFVTLHVIVSMILVLRHMERLDLFALDVFHEDECGGLATFGTLNLLAMLVTTLVLITELAIFFTHLGIYTSNSVALFITTLILIGQSFLGVWHIHKFIQNKKRTLLGEVNRRLNLRLYAATTGGNFPGGLLAARNHVASLRSFPYTRGIRGTVNSLRYASALGSVVTFLLAH